MAGLAEPGGPSGPSASFSSASCQRRGALRRLGANAPTSLWRPLHMSANGSGGDPAEELCAPLPQGVGPTPGSPVTQNRTDDPGQLRYLGDILETDVAAEATQIANVAELDHYLGLKPGTVGAGWMLDQHKVDLPSRRGGTFGWPINWRWLTADKFCATPWKVRHPPRRAVPRCRYRVRLASLGDCP